jgi:hypothetical protein
MCRKCKRKKKDNAYNSISIDLNLNEEHGTKMKPLVVSGKLTFSMNSRQIARFQQTTLTGLQGIVSELFRIIVQK